MRGWSSGLTPHGARTLLWSGFRTSRPPCSSARRCAAAGAEKNEYFIIFIIFSVPSWSEGSSAGPRPQQIFGKHDKTCFPMDSHSKSLANMIGTWHPMDSHTNACFACFLHLFHVDSCFFRHGKTSKPAKRRAAALNRYDSCFVGTVERTRA